MRLRGILSFPLTPFTEDDTVALDAFTTHVKEQIAQGPSGLLVACGTGEFTALNANEYRAIITTAVAVAAERLPVFAGTGGGARPAAQHARIAADPGANVILLLPSYLVSSTPAGLVRHVAHVAAATDLPLVVYQRANAVLDPAAAVALLDIPTVADIKDGRGDIDATAGDIAERARIIEAGLTTVEKL
ncbi:dihydrodipicolinate synthase family protein [Streptomyces sp. NPDC055709]